MIGWILTLFGKCQHTPGRPMACNGNAGCCTKCGALIPYGVDLSPVERFAVPVRPMVAIEGEGPAKVVSVRRKAR